MTNKETLPEALLKEIYRNKELLKEYEKIGPAGVFGATFIRHDICAGEKALLEHDAIAMVRSLSALRDSE